MLEDLTATADPDQKICAKRRNFMAVLAAATLDEITSGLERTAPNVAFTELRRPEIGLVMIRGRMGGKGPAFNVGEATVTRATVRLSSNEVGFSCVLGRMPEKARYAALADALWQKPELAPALKAEIIEPVQQRLAHEAAAKAAATAATKVNFFTMVRGDD
jgi:alpha-D-ribose 1-methylphosphonate 5-triphosphate synthase subunit PhnG